MISISREIKSYKFNNYISGKLMMYGTELSSPFSLLSVLIPLTLGLSGETLEETCRSLKISPCDLKKLFLDISNFNEDLENAKDINLTNIMLSNKNFSLKPEYLQSIEKVINHGYFDEKNILSVI